jgi:myosin heavy subunit
MLRQLKTSGVMDSIKIRQIGYPRRTTFGIFANKYRYLVPSKVPSNEQLKDNNICIQLCRSILQSIYPSSTHEWQIGHTKVFWKTNVDDALNQSLRRVKNVNAVKIQQHIRGMLTRHKLMLIKQAKKQLDAALISDDVETLQLAVLEAQQLGIPQRFISDAATAQARLSAQIQADEALKQALKQSSATTISSRLLLLSQSIQMASLAELTIVSAARSSFAATASENLKKAIHAQNELEICSQGLQDALTSTLTCTQSATIGLEFIKRIEALNFDSMAEIEAIRKQLTSAMEIRNKLKQLMDAKDLNALSKSVNDARALKMTGNDIDEAEVNYIAI